MKKVIVQCLGGLGNQMFIYAFGKALENALSRELLFDRNGKSIGAASVSGGRPFALDCFPNISIKWATQHQISQALGNGFITRVRRKINRILGNQFSIPEGKEFTISAKYDEYVPELLSVPENRAFTYYSGYWQNESYFKSIESKIRYDFTFDLSLDSYNARLLDKIQKAGHSVAVHIRRGDYAHLGWSLPLDYYKKAINKLNEQYDSCTYFVFGQVDEEVRDFLKNYNCIFVGDHNTETKQDYRDMQLMTCCENAIIANSSFSWWGAWLGKSEKQIVCAPSPWLGESDAIIPQNWIKFQR